MSTSPIRISSRSWEASASTRPNGSQKKEPPQNSSPAPGAMLPRTLPFSDADTIHYRDVDAVGDGVRTLDGAPRVVLSCAELGLLRRMPADCRGIEKQWRPSKSGEPRSLRIPLIPADERADFSNSGLESAESEVAGSEIEFFVVKRVVGNMHLAVNAAQRAIASKMAAVL